ncbi:MAG: hypothetical protein SPE13_02635, partial [Alloprevotella sp.]|nr:hypothetical protein [Alloprevotella sp.]
VTSLAMLLPPFSQFISKKSNLKSNLKSASPNPQLNSAHPQPILSSSSPHPLLIYSSFRRKNVVFSA